jgi:hypothetical protein
MAIQNSIIWKLKERKTVKCWSKAFEGEKKCYEFFLKENLGEKNHGRVFLSRKTPIRHQGRFYRN